MTFIHTAPERAGFYRNSESAMVEALVIKHNAANGPKRPTETPQQARVRVDAQRQKVTTPVTLDSESQRAFYERLVTIS